MMPLLKIIRHGQVTLPAAFRQELAIKEGDYLEAELKDDCIVLRPQVLMDRNTAIQSLHRVMDTVQQRTDGIDPLLIEKEVAEAIKAVRAQRHDV